MIVQQSPQKRPVKEITAPPVQLTEQAPTHARQQMGSLGIWDGAEVLLNKMYGNDIFLSHAAAILSFKARV